LNASIGGSAKFQDERLLKISDMKTNTERLKARMECAEWLVAKYACDHVATTAVTDSVMAPVFGITSKRSYGRERRVSEK